MVETSAAMTKAHPSIPVAWQEQVALKPLTTMRVGGPARYFMAARSVDDVCQALLSARELKLPVLILGGGSNLVVPDEGFPGLVLKMELAGFEIVAEDEATVTVRAAAGETWDGLVARCAEAGYWGFENLAGIPSTVGAAPIQNIGAYGQEAADTLIAVDALGRASLEPVALAKEECSFQYRQSIFNTTHKGRFAITAVTFRLRKEGAPCCSHRSVREWVEQQAVETLSAADMRRGILAIRGDGRLPDPAHIGNAGSFFKNPVVSRAQFEEACRQVQDQLGAEAAAQLRATSFAVADDHIKVSAGQLIRLTGAAGLQRAGARLYSRNPLVIINESGQATAADVLALAGLVRERVEKQTGLLLHQEPMIAAVTE